MLNTRSQKYGLDDISKEENSKEHDSDDGNEDENQNADWTEMPPPPPGQESNKKRKIQDLHTETETGAPNKSCSSTAV